jgi:hypothetical protein
MCVCTISIQCKYVLYCMLIIWVNLCILVRVGKSYIYINTYICVYIYIVCISMYVIMYVYICTQIYCMYKLQYVYVHILHEARAPHIHIWIIMQNSHCMNMRLYITIQPKQKGGSQIHISFYLLTQQGDVRIFNSFYGQVEIPGNNILRPKTN